MSYNTPGITPVYGMNGVQNRHDPWVDAHEGRAYAGPLVNILTGEHVDPRISIEQRAAGLERSLAIAAMANRLQIPRTEAAARHSGSAVAAAEVGQPEALTVEAAMAEALQAIAPVSPAPTASGAMANA